MWTISDTELQAAIDASTGRTPSLADNSDFRSAAQTLDDLGTYNLYLASSDALEIPAFYEDYPKPDPDSLLEPYRLMAFGGGVDDQGPFVALVLIFESDEAAADNANRLRHHLETGETVIAATPLAERYPSADVATDGSAVVATMRGESVAYNLLTDFHRRDSLFWTE